MQINIKRLIIPILFILCGYLSGCSYGRVEKYNQLDAFSSKDKKKGSGLSSKPIKDFRGNRVRQEDIAIMKEKVDQYICQHKDMNEERRSHLMELTVAGGATKEDVELLLGKPLKIVKFKNLPLYSEMWVYKTEKTDSLPMLDIPVSIHRSYRLYFKDNSLVSIEMHYLKRDNFGARERMKSK